MPGRFLREYRLASALTESGIQEQGRPDTRQSKLDRPALVVKHAFRELRSGKARLEGAARVFGGYELAVFGKGSHATAPYGRVSPPESRVRSSGSSG